MEALVILGASTDPARLDEHLASSTEFRAEALAHFLRVAALRPLFFRAVQRFEVSPEQLSKLLAPYPELQWSLEMHALPAKPADAEWRAAAWKVEKVASSVVRTEKHSAAKREIFAALAAVAHRASGADLAETGDVAEAACLDRLHRVCVRFGADAPMSAETAKRPSPDAPPASAEETLQQLVKCVRPALRELRAADAEGRLISDAARLARRLERDLEERKVDIGAVALPASTTEDSATTAATVHALQHLWKEVVLAEEEAWHEVLSAPEGVPRDVQLGTLSFCRMALWSDRGLNQAVATSAMPRTAAPEALCAAFPELRPLAPALRLVTSLPQARSAAAAA